MNENEAIKDSCNTINRGKLIAAILFAAVPVAAGLLYSLYSNQSLFHIYLPAGWWNDELFYYKQVEAIINYGIPRGFFSYNEVAPAIGSFNSWSPVLYLPYVIIGRVIGWNYYTPLVCNLAFVCFAFFMWIRAVTCQKYKNAGIVLLYCFCLPVTQLVFSGMVEALLYALVIIWLSLHLDSGKSKWKCVLQCVIAAYLTIARPYCVILYVVMIYSAWKDRKNKQVLSLTGLSALSFLGYFLLSKYFCAPYVIPLIKSAYFTPLLEGNILLFFKEIFNAFWVEFSTTHELIKSIFAGQSSDIILSVVAQAYFAYYLLIICFVMCLVYYIIKKKKDKIREVSYILIFDILFLMAVFILYYTVAGYRHILLAVVLNIFLLGYYLPEKTLLGTGILYLVFYIIQLFRYKLRTEERTERFGEIFKLEKGVSWDNTVVYVNGLDYTALYSLPKGFGISVCMQDYMQKTTDIKSKYVVINPEIEYENPNFEQIFQDEKCRVYIRKSSYEKK